VNWRCRGDGLHSGVLWLSDHRRRLLSHHYDRRVRVAGNVSREDGSVCHTQPFDAMRPQLRINHRHSIIAHLARSHRVIAGFERAADESRHFFITIRLRGGPQLLAAIRREGIGLRDLARQLESCEDHRKIAFTAEIVGLNRRRRRWVIRPQADLSVTFGMFEHDPDGKAMTGGIVETVSHVKNRREHELDVGSVQVCPGLDESARLGDVGAERAALQEQIVDYIPELLRIGQADGLRTFVVHGHQMMILQVLPDTGITSRPTRACSCLPSRT